MISNTQVGKLQREQSGCLNLVRSQYSHQALGILCVKDLIDLEMVKFGYKLINGMLPLQIELCTKTDAKGNYLQKGHRYDTHHKQLPNLPRAQITKYLKSIFCQGINKYNALPSDLKHQYSYDNFCGKCKKYYLNNLMG